MIKKIILLVFILYISASRVHSQGVSVNLSIDKGNIENSQSDKNGGEIPYLNITYTNNSGFPVYFLKISYDKSELPDFFSERFNNTLNDCSNFPDYSGSKYNVMIYDSNYTNFNVGTIWEVLIDSLSFFQEHESDYINNDLEDAYNFYKKEHGIEENVYHKEYDFRNEENIWEKFEEYFVFLEDGQSFTDRYNLWGFQKLKGEYKFSIDRSEFRNFVRTNSKWNNEGQIVHDEYKLPKRIGKYHLYEGTFHANEVTVKF